MKIVITKMAIIIMIIVSMIKQSSRGGILIKT